MREFMVGESIESFIQLNWGTEVELNRGETIWIYSLKWRNVEFFLHSIVKRIDLIKFEKWFSLRGFYILLENEIKGLVFKWNWQRSGNETWDQKVSCWSAIKARALMFPLVGVVNTGKWKYKTFDVALKHHPVCWMLVIAFAWFSYVQLQLSSVFWVFFALFNVI